MVHRAFEFHHSRYLALAKVGHQIVLFVRAYVHESMAKPGYDPGTGWVQAITIVIDRAELFTEEPTGEFDIWSGELVQDGVTSEGLVALPHLCEGELRLRLSGTDGEVFEVMGARIEAQPVGGAHYVEEFLGA